MKTTLYSIIGATALLGACQRYNADGDQARISNAYKRPAAAAAAPVQAPKPVATAKAEPVPELTPAMLQMLQAYDLAPLWEAETHDATASNGFFGPDHYRIEFIFLSVERDSLQPQVYHIRGKNRHKKHITPFEGTLTLNHLQDFPASKEQLPEDFGGQVYTATGTFVLNEDPASKYAGSFKGKMVVDFAVHPNLADEKVVVWSWPADPKVTPTQGSGYKFEGEWQEYASGRRKPVLWARDVFMIADDVLQNFVVGERDITINPIYAKLGWDNYWENDEWWAESPMASL